MPDPDAPAPENPDFPQNPESASLAAQQASKIALLDVGDGYAMLFADHAPADMDLFGFDLLGQNSSQRLVDQISTAAVGGNLLTLGLNALPQAQGIVRLAPESMQLLNQAGNSLMQSAGQSLGTIINGSGTVIGQARLLPAAGAQTAMLGAAMGPAAALLALHIQLASISRRVDENIELTRDVLRAIHEDQWATLVALHETSLQALQEAEASGTVNQHIFAPLATRQADLRKSRKLFLDFVRDHLQNLTGDVKSRRSYIQLHFDQIIADSHGMLMAEFAWYRAQVLRGILISHDAQNSETDERLLTHHVEETKSKHADAMREISGLLAEVECQVRLLSLLPAARALPFTSKRRNADEALAMAEALASSVAALRNQVRSRHEVVAPEISVFKTDVPDKLANILAWSLPEQSRILALADANLDRLLANNVYLGITDSVFFVADQGDATKEGIIETLIPLADVRYARFTERTKKGPSLEVITKEDNFAFTFDSWAAGGPALEAARRIGNLFSSVMNLPVEEQRTDPLIPVNPESHSPRNQIGA